MINIYKYARDGVCICMGNYYFFLWKLRQVEVPRGPAYSQCDLKVTALEQSTMAKFWFQFNLFHLTLFFSLHTDKLQILKFRKIPLETLGKTKECLFVSAPSFQASRFPDPTSQKHLSFSSAFFMPPFSYNLFLSCLIRPHFPLFSHTALLTVNPQCWLRDEKLLGCLNHILRQVQGEIPTDEY